MVVPSYTTDLLTIDLAEAATNWAEPSAVGWTAGAAPAQDDDNPFQGSYAVSKAFNATGVGGMLANKGSGMTIPEDGAFTGWFFWGAPGSLESDANGGIRFMCGTDLANFLSWDVGGLPSYTYGGWTNFAVNTTVTADDTVGTGLGNSQYSGAAVNNLNSIFKGSPFLCDGFRFGRCEARMNGGEAANYATFAGYAAINDANNGTDGYNRWGLIQAIAGGYLIKGLMILGYSSVVDFRDSNKNLFIQCCPKVTANFNTIEVRQAGSRVDWTGISITSLSVATLPTASKGRFLTTDNADVNIDTCTFTDMNTFLFMSGATILSTTFRRCGIVTQGSAVFTNCKFDNPSGVKALVMDVATSVTNCDFISDGTGYAIEGFNTAGSYNIATCTFTGYAAGPGSTGNESLHVLATSGVVDIYAPTGTSYHTDGATVNIISGQVSATVTVKTLAGANIENARVLVTATSGPMPYDVTVTITRIDSTATVSHTAHGMATNDKVQIKGANQWEYNGVYTITKINNDSYSYTVTGTPETPATGIIKATYAALSGLTNTSGVITMSRVFLSTQPISGKVRKSTGSPIYKTSTIIGEISNTSGFSTTVQMIPDE